MAVQFHELPPEVFPDAARPYVARLNRELRELFALEGVIRQPRATKRSDDSIARRGEVQVDVSRITPDLSEAIAGSSTVIGAPNLTFGTVNAVGTTRTVVSVNSSVALFDAGAPEAVSLIGGLVGTAAVAARRDHVHDIFTAAPNFTLGTSNVIGTTNSVVHSNASIALFDTTVPAGISTGATVGVASFAARRDHVHNHPEFASGDLHTEYFLANGTRNLTGVLTTTNGQFTSTVADSASALGFHLNTSTTYSSGKILTIRNNASERFFINNTYTRLENSLGVGQTPTAGFEELVNAGKSTALTSGNMFGFRVLLINSTSSAGSANMLGGFFEARVAGTGDSLNSLTGNRCIANISTDAKTPNDLIAFDARTQIQNSTTSTVGNQIDYYAGAGTYTGSTAATITNRRRFWGVADVFSASSVTVTNYYGIDLESPTVATITNNYGVNVDALSIGTNRWAFWGSNKIHCDASDFIANTNAKGLVTKDSQGTARFWRLYIDAAAGTTGGATISVDAAGAITASRVAGATGTIDIKIVDVGTAAPLT